MAAEPVVALEYLDVVATREQVRGAEARNAGTHDGNLHGTATANGIERGEGSRMALCDGRLDRGGRSQATGSRHRQPGGVVEVLTPELSL